MTTGILWARVSSSEQALGYSLDGQTDMLRKAAAERGIRVIREFKIHESGSRSERRKHFKEMVALATETKVGVILIFKIDRLARNYKDFYSLQELIEKGIGILVVNENRQYDLRSSSSDRFHFRVMGDVAQLEAEQIAERTVLGMKAKLSSGEIPWMATLGYRNAPDASDVTGRKRTIIIDDVAAPLVKQAFELYSTGEWTVSSLTEEMNRRGLRNKISHRPVTRRAVEELLKNHFYVGQFWDKKADRWREHSYPTFITQDLFGKVQSRLKDARRNTTGYRSTWNRWPYKPLLRCGFCGAHITAYSPKAGQNYYDCAASHVKRHGHKKCQDSVIFSAAKLEHMLGEAVSRLYINDQIAERVRASLSTEHEARSRASERRLRHLQSEVVRLTAHLDISYQDMLDQRLTRERFEAAQVTTQSRITTAQDEIARLQVVNTDYQSQGSEILTLLKGVSAAWAAADADGRVNMLRVMVKQVHLLDHRIEVDWIEPFGVLASIGELALRKGSWGK
jgi:site-specific DNA recombinase